MLVFIVIVLLIIAVFMLYPKKEHYEGPLNSHHQNTYRNELLATSDGQYSPQFPSEDEEECTRRYWDWKVGTQGAFPRV